MGRKATISADAILDIAEDIVLTEGVAHLTIDNIAKKLGITKGGVQYSFASKDAIIEKLITRWNDTFDAEMRKYMPENPTPAQYLRAHIRATHIMDQGYKKGAGLMAALLDNQKFREISQGWYRKRLEALTLLPDAEQAPARLAFLACEGLFLLASFGFAPCDEAAWNAVFTDIDNILLNKSQS